MAQLRLKFVHRFRDRHGKVRHYFRRKGFKDVPLAGLPGSEVFMLAYQAALAGETAPRLEIGADRSKPGTIAALVAAYFASSDFQGLAPSTRITYRNIIERFRAEYGALPVNRLERRHIRAMIEKRAKTPAAANNLLKRIRSLIRFALAIDMIEVDPSTEVRGVRSKSPGYHTWSEEEISQFVERHKPGSKPHLAPCASTYTGQRRSDVVRMGRQHVRNGVLSIRQQKTKAVVEVPLHPELEAALKAAPADDLTFLRTAFGQPFTSNGFGNWFRERCNEADLPRECSSHGLRKAAARRLAEVGCTTHEIAAITGHESLREVERYTRAFDRKDAAISAMAKLKDGTRTRKP
ncbi:MAG: tyrosine-type recombinase/integrase [Rhodospirillaceae bacterium]|nr:tyrosine-type recombinase/integrase [Rhodospirillaceae bacterium]